VEQINMHPATKRVIQISTEEMKKLEAHAKNFKALARKLPTGPEREHQEELAETFRKRIAEYKDLIKREKLRPGA
jgi:hypothetical protein